MRNKHRKDMSKLNKRNIKAFFRLTMTFTLIFAIVAATIFAIIIDMKDGEIFGITVGPSSTHVNVLLLGVDKDGTRTDVMIMGQLNLVNDSITMIQIPRDTYVPDNGRGDKKINSAYASGIDSTLKEVEMVTGVKIDKYVKIDTSQFRNIIDEIGGIKYDVPIDMHYDDPAQDLHIHIDKGYQTLDGAKAEQFVRFRQNNDGSGYPRGDVERLDAQKGFIKETMSQLFFKNTLKIPALVSTFSKMIETNFSNGELVSYMPSVFDIKQENISIITLAGEAKYIRGGSYYVPDKLKNDELIDLYFYQEGDPITPDEIEQ